MKADAKKQGMSGDNKTPDGSGGNGAARIDKLIADSRDLLQKPGGDCLVTEIEARLLNPWCAELPAAVSKRLPRLIALWTGIKRWSWRLMLVYLLYTVASASVSFYFEKQIEKWHKSDLYTDLHLSVNFFVRKLAIWSGTPKMDRLQELSDSQACVIANPFYRKPLVCCNCRFNITLSKVTNVKKVMDNFDKLTTSGKARSFLIINYDQEPVSYARIRQTALENEADINIGYSRFITLSGPSVRGLHQLFASESGPPAASAIVWRFDHVEALRHFRPLVNRPAFVSRSLEINLPRQFLFFGADSTERVPLGSLSELDGQVYIVGLAGDIVFTVKSNPECCKKPENQVVRSAVLRPGRMLSMPSGCYEVFARRNGTEFAAAYMGSVAMSQHPATQRDAAKPIKK